MFDFRRLASSPSSPKDPANQDPAGLPVWATRQKIFSDFDKNRQKEIDAGRWIRQNAFGATPNAHNILQDKIDLYDPDF